MSDKPEKKAPDTAKPEAAEPAPDKKPGALGGMLGYIIAGVGALVVTALVVLTLGGDDAAKTDQATQIDSNSVDSVSQQPEHAQEQKPAELPDIFADLDPSKLLSDSSTMKAAGAKSGELTALQPASQDSQGLPTDSESSDLNWIEKEKKRLATLEKALNEKAERLEALDRSITQKLKRAEAIESERVASLARLYDGMKPEESAPVIFRLADTTIIKILPRMKSQNAAKVLALLPPEMSARLSRQMITLSEN